MRENNIRAIEDHARAAVSCLDLKDETIRRQLVAEKLQSIERIIDLALKDVMEPDLDKST